MLNLSKLLVRCNLCRNGVWFGRFVTMSLKTQEGDHDIKVCKECNRAIEYWQERTLMRTGGKVEVSK